jgi:DNA-binding NarL/FixJ family response regulator
MLSESDFKFDDLEVAIVENDPSSLRGLRFSLEQLGCQVAWAARDDEEAMALARSNLPEVVFVDLRLLQGSDDYDPGWQLIKSLRQRGVGRPFTIIIYSGTPIVDAIVLKAIRLGCSYIVKEDLWGHEQEIVLGALLAARSGSVFLSNEVATGLETIVSHMQNRDVLSPKEMEVAHLIADGLSNQEIATRLVLSVTTIKTHVSRILAKLQVDNRGKAAEWYRQQYG